MNLKSMSIDKLSTLKEQVAAALSAEVIEERRAVQDQLSKLDRLAAGGSRGKGVRGALQGAVAPKYRNPANPTETWAGRGLRPRWLAAALKTGKQGARKEGPGGTEESSQEIDWFYRGPSFAMDHG